MSAPTSDSAAIRQTIRALIADGWELDSVWDGADAESISNETEAINAIVNLDQAHLYFAKDGQTGWVFFVLGNSPDEVICDYTTNLENVVDSLIDKWSD